MALQAPRRFSRLGLVHCDENTPLQPYLTFPLGPENIQRIVVKIWSHDQGYCNSNIEPTGTHDISHTRFAFGLLQDPADGQEPQDFFEFQRNEHALSAIQCHTNEWTIGLPNEQHDGQDFQAWLESVNHSELVEVGVFPFAQHQEWVNTVWKMEIEIHVINVSCVETFSSASRLDNPEAYIDNTTALDQRSRPSSATVVLQKSELIPFIRQGIQATRTNDHHHAGQLEKLAGFLTSQYRLSRSIDDHNLAVDVLSLIVKNTPHEHPRRVSRSVDFAQCLSERFLASKSPSMDDLTRAIDIFSQVAQNNIRSADLPEFNNDPIESLGILNNLGNLLSLRYDRTGMLGDLDQAIEFLNFVIEVTPRGHYARAARLNTLAKILTKKAQHDRSMPALRRAIELTQVAIDETPEHHSSYPSRLNNLANRLGFLFDRTGSIDDIDAAVKAAELSLNITPQGHSNRPSRLENLAQQLRRRFERTGSMDDINHSIKAVNDGIQMSLQNDPSTTELLATLGTCLGRRFDRTGSMDDLNAAIEALGTSVDRLPNSFSDGILHITNLSVLLCRRHECIGNMDDIDRAVDILEGAIKHGLIPPDHFGRAVVFSDLASACGMRFHRTRSIADINRAVSMLRNAIDLTPKDHPYYPVYQTNLGNWLGSRYVHLLSNDDLDMAVDSLNAAVDSTPSNLPERAVRLSNLGRWLGTRYHVSKAPDDIEKAIRLVEEASELLPEDHHDRANLLSILGGCYGHRFEATGSASDLNQRLYYSIQSWNCLNSPPSVRINSAWWSFTILNAQNRFKEASLVANQAINILSSVSPRSLKAADQQHMVAQFAHMASEAAATALEAGDSPDDVLRLLEVGRGVISSLLLETRTEISELKRAHPDLAETFEALRDKLDSTTPRAPLLTPGDHTPSWEFQTKQRRELDEQFRSVINDIRSRPGFQGFLLPPDIQELQAAALPGPIVVINTSHWRCDAFLVTSSDIEVVSLPKLKLSELETTGPISLRLLESLWDSVAEPVLDKLGFLQPPAKGEAWPHVWWISVGVLSRLPLHAAGYHSESCSKTVLDRVVSSYSTSIKALLHARGSSSRKRRSETSRNAFLVSMETTPPHLHLNPLELRFAGEEIQRLDGILSPDISRTRLVQPLKEDVLQHIEGCTIFHFAGHGVSDPLDPSQSCLLLQDWVNSPLTVENLTSVNLSRKTPWIAYLSACSTGENQAERLQDESIHLVNACQLAGFPHVVGSLWMIDDESSADAAAEVYRTIQEHGWTDRSVALGVHNAARLLRQKTSGESREVRTRRADMEVIDRGKTGGVSNAVRLFNGQGDLSNSLRGLEEYAVRNEGNPSIWAAYIHVGP